MNNQKLDEILKDPRTNWKYVALVAVLALLVLGGIMICQDWKLLTQKIQLPEGKVPEKVLEEVSANWKTYRNDKHGYEIKYPSDFKLNIWTDHGGHENKEFISPVVKDSLILIGEQEKQENKSLSDWTDEYIKMYTGYQFDPPEYIIIDSNPAIYYKSLLVPSENRNSYFVFMEVNHSTIIHFGLSNINVEENASLKAIFDQMLSTFRFVE